LQLCHDDPRRELTLQTITTRLIDPNSPYLDVDDQDKGLRFYTEVLGFKKKHDIPVGEYRWITVTSPEGPDDLELALEPNANPAGKAFQEAMFAGYSTRGLRGRRHRWASSPD
jgi:catechol 2,3-dioxygenase-like lactoylglutathione lyase family enzyme